MAQERPASELRYIGQSDVPHGTIPQDDDVDEGAPIGLTRILSQEESLTGLILLSVFVVAGFIAGVLFFAHLTGVAIELSAGL